MGIRHPPRHAFVRPGGARAARRRGLRGAGRARNPPAGAVLADQPHFLQPSWQPGLWCADPLPVRQARCARAAAPRLSISHGAQGILAVGRALVDTRIAVSARAVLLLHTLITGIAGLVFFVFPREAATIW